VEAKAMDEAAAQGAQMKLFRTLILGFAISLGTSAVLLLLLLGAAIAGIVTDELTSSYGWLADLPPILSALVGTFYVAKRYPHRAILVCLTFLPAAYLLTAITALGVCGFTGGCP
jgi:hypothetical protein